MADKYRFPATLAKVGLASKKETLIIGEGPLGKPMIEKVDVPHLTLTLTLTGEQAAEIAAGLMIYQGMECALDISTGEPRQFRLLQ